jgi:hypothetical protein
MISNTLVLLSRIMTKLLAIVVIASVCMFAQEAKPQEADEVWEYCVAETNINAGFRDGRYEAKVQVCYASDRGCKEETFVLSEAAPDRLQRQYLEWEAAGVTNRAIAKTLAQLGKDRWQLVSVVETPYPPPDRPMVRSKSFYFKRRAR